MQETSPSLANPILNSPYEIPGRYWELGENGPTGVVVEARRPSESFTPIAPVRKRGKAQDTSVQESILLTHETVQRNDVINQLRTAVDIWRSRDYEGATPTSKKLLRHWADENRENRVLFAQREAAETAIYLAEVAGREKVGTNYDWRAHLAGINAEYNADLPRIAFKMATGSGKTVVMCMLIAWQTLNKIQSPRDHRFVRRFLVVTPGITIRDRLRVLQPNDPENYYDQRELVPPELRPQLGKAQILVVNYHQFLLRDTKEIKGVSATTRKILANGKADPFKETEPDMVSRVLRGWGVGSGKKQSEILVINDEAHHCYMDKPITIEGDAADAEDKQRNGDARVWFKGIQAIAEKVGVKNVYDLSATPFYLQGSGHKEGLLFPWVVSDFGLMDAIEAGIVKVPRTPVDDNAEGDLVTYLNLYEHLKNDPMWPKSTRKKITSAEWVAPDALVGALRSLYASYESSYTYWKEHLEPLGHTPPVFIVVCPNTVASRLVHDWIAGFQVGDRWASGNLELFSNVVDGVPIARPRTILVDSAQLESGEALSKDFKEAAGPEIESYKAELRLRNPGVDVEGVTDEDLLREVMNTVGKKGRLGEQVRCVVSVAMLTEGWDANTVSHILGARAFKSQLLCEQVVGRGLRRRSYDVNEDGLFEPEYANVYGVPFAFIPTDKPAGPEQPPKPTTLVQSMAGREQARITFPRLTGYRLEVPERGRLHLPEGDLPEFVVGGNVGPTWTRSDPIVGMPDVVAEVARDARVQEVAFHLANRLIRTHYRTDRDAGDERRWLFPELVPLCADWIKRAVRVEDGYSYAYLVNYPQLQTRAVDAIYRELHESGGTPPRLVPLLHPFEPVGSTERVSFLTRKPAIPTDPERCEVSHVVLDGRDGNTWEQLMAAYAEGNPDVAAYVKNDHLGFEIPYLHLGTRHDYVPDFLMRLKQREDDVVRTLVVEVSGGEKRLKAASLTDMKVTAARDLWCRSVNTHGGFGVWGYLEVTDPNLFKVELDDAIARLYADEPSVVGEPDPSFHERDASEASSA